MMQRLFEPLYLLTQQGNFVLVLHHFRVKLRVLAPELIHLSSRTLSLPHLVLKLTDSPVCLVKLTHLTLENTIEPLYFQTELLKVALIGLKLQPAFVEHL